jgi:SAM-dependent methyltransferase
MATTSQSSSVNYWPDSACARAFWGQQELPPYRKLLADTTVWLDPHPGERWLDLGCGCGKLSQAIWEKSNGSVAEIIALDVAAENHKAYEKLRASVQPPASSNGIRFIAADFSAGLASWQDCYFDGAVSGLAIQYAESYSEIQGCWTTDAYDHLLTDVHRVLRPGGRFIFSVNVPEPGWGKVALCSLLGFFGSRKPARYLTNAWQMMRYGSWLKRQARLGRFHYLPLAEIVTRLARTGFVAIEHRFSYAMQAYLIRCGKSD